MRDKAERMQMTRAEAERTAAVDISEAIKAKSGLMKLESTSEAFYTWELANSVR